MSSVISFAAGAQNYYSNETVASEMFGGIYAGYRNLNRFDIAADYIGLSSIRWPDGHAAETAEWYGLEFEDLVDPNSNKAGLSTVMAYAVENSMALNLIIPSTDYVANPDKASVDILSFLTRLFNGEFGALPSSIVIEVGNEYYAHNIFDNNAAAYGEIANVILETIIDYQLINPDAFPGTDMNIAVQMGKTEADNSTILSNISSKALSVIDSLITHRFAWTFDGADKNVIHETRSIAEWVDAGARDDLQLFLSAWNVASWTRKEALEKYIKLYKRHFGVELDSNEIDLTARNDPNFETYWQIGVLIGPDGSPIQTKDGVAYRDYGLAQASAMIEIFATYLEIGADAAVMYGMDSQHAAKLSFGTNMYVGATMLSMMAETLPGTQLISTNYVNSRDDQVNVRAYQGDDEIVVYLSVDDFDESNGPYIATFDLTSLGYQVLNVSGRSLKSEIPEDWMQQNGVVDHPDVDESAEANIYAVGVVEDLDLDFSNGNLNLAFDQDYQVIELIVTLSDATLYGTEFNDKIIASESNNTIVVSAGNDTIDGAGGIDSLDFSELTTPVNVNGQSYQSTYADGIFQNIESLIGTSKSDFFIFTEEIQEIHGGDGNDVFNNVGGNGSIIYGEGGDDLILMENGSVAFGGAGNDKISSSEGDEYIDAGSGDDHIIVRNGNDVVVTGIGNDIVWIQSLINSTDIQIVDFDLAADTLLLFGATDFRSDAMSEFALQQGEDLVFKIGDDWIITLNGINIDDFYL